MKHYDANIEWYLQCAGHELGEKSSLGGQIATLERGGPVTATSDATEWHRDLAAVARARQLGKVWAAMPTHCRSVLSDHYRGHMRSGDERNGFNAFPPGVGGTLGDVAAVTLRLAADFGELEDLLEACAKPKEQGHPEVIRRWTEHSDWTLARAHGLWKKLYRKMSPAAAKAREKLGFDQETGSDTAAAKAEVAPA